MEKISIILFLSCLVLSCNNEVQKNYSQITVDYFNIMNDPIILIAKSKSMGLYSVIIKDSTGECYFMGNSSSFANGIGEYYEVGDTIGIKKK